MSGQGSISRNNATPVSGPPFSAASAANGLSVNGAGKIVLGNDTGGNAAALLNNREIPLAGFSVTFSDLPNQTDIVVGGASIRVHDTVTPSYQAILSPGALSLDDTVGLSPSITFNSTIGIVRNVSELAIVSGGLGDRFLSIDTATRIIKLGSIDGANKTFLNIDDSTGIFDFQNSTVGGPQISMNGVLGFTGTVTPVVSITVVGGIVTNVI